MFPRGLFDTKAAFRQKTSIPPRRLARCGKATRANADFGIRPSRLCHRSHMKPPVCRNKSRPNPWGLRVPSSRRRKGGLLSVVSWALWWITIQSALRWNAILDIQHRVRVLNVRSTRTAIRCKRRTPDCPWSSIRSRLLVPESCPLFSFWGVPTCIGLASSASFMAATSPHTLVYCFRGP
ncbi:hypothetical protein BKA58DRAFT_222349 [Alternaria rosae]|uniref:uncharacterized protein n=1 Tax=Alternaria rosae TaxID=1187941 RepID=UPI001E8E69C7|nr:uncharacterized protein BKA58DRAFT_222349 [Alternaria rosae]KAH6865480.1 hypothetical protein BKA58DRAFT_222349 [Alternaria rosae]